MNSDTKMSCYLGSQRAKLAVCGDEARRERCSEGRFRSRTSRCNIACFRLPKRQWTTEGECGIESRVGCCAIALLGVTSGCATEGQTTGPTDIASIECCRPFRRALWRLPFARRDLTGRRSRVPVPRSLPPDRSPSLSLTGGAPIDCASARSSRTVGLDVNFAGLRSGPCKRWPTGCTRPYVER